MQQTIVVIILVLAVSYAVWHVYKALRHDSEPCCGCEGCPLKGHGCQENHKNPDCCRKN
ncbi:MAG: FeoB-associated Cys-rich membrane protein [Prevotella sp.]|nr:FeoB-associated Cys-rich membrane protein [Prevotella sp.]